MYPCIYLSIHLSIHPSKHHLCIHPSIHTSFMYPFIIYLYLSIHPFIHPSIHLCIYPLIYPFMYSIYHLSIVLIPSPYIQLRTLFPSSIQIKKLNWNLKAIPTLIVNGSHTLLLITTAPTLHQMLQHGCGDLLSFKHKHQ